ncbi:MAG: 2Fe-2S iron-sulfur cluster binding domain-containing protein [Armatimonadetes bacterium]|nr:2Fe-2S iron-sulfur cluster binding domain-containing protein [Armatimonadota bacterium]MBM4436056.1 molybdopterin-dependent oxidoreductase [Actinomycetota bacterium]
MTPDAVTLAIDGRDVQVPRGWTVLQACESAGVEIPTLCTDPRLKPYGACRMCVVEIQPGPPRPTASCTTPAANGMKVVTNSASIKAVRRHVIELQLQHHPLDCPYCDQAGTCELQDETFAQDIHQSPYETVSKAFPEEILNEVILINHNRCIQCGRCVRMCDEQIGVHALDFVQRGVSTFIAPAQHKFMDCERCGMCIETCPVGALLSRPFKHSARSWQTEKAASTCPHCAVGCALLVESRHGAVVRTRANGLEDPGRGILCAKGFFGHSFVDSPERIQRPLMRKNGMLTAVPWSEALHFVADRLREVRDRYGPSAIGVVGSPNCTNEDNYALQKLARAVLGTNNVYSQDDGFHTTYRAITDVLGSGALLRPQDDLLQADLILIAGADIGQSHNVVGAHIKAAARFDGRRLVVATRLATGFDQFATATARVRPGSEASFLAALAGVEIAQIEAKTGVSAAQLARLRELLASARSVAVVWDTGLWTRGRAERIARAVANLALAYPDVRLFPLAERANAVGTLLTGMAPDELPGLRALSDAAERAAFEQIVGATTPATPGLAWPAFAYAGRLKALYVMGEDVVGGAEEPDALRAALASAELVVVQDIFMNATAALAHVVLPGASFAEKGGHFTNFEGRWGRLTRAIGSVGEARPDWEIVARLAATLGGDFGWRTDAPITAELEQVWRVPPTTGSREAAHVDGAAAPDASGDALVLATEQHLYTAGVTGRFAPSFTVMLPEAIAELNDEDAGRLSLTSGDRITLSAEMGALDLKVLVSARVPRGVVSLPDRFIEAPPRSLHRRTPDGVGVKVTKR